MAGMYDEIEVRCIDLAGKVNALSSAQWSDAASKAGDTRTQEMFVNDIMTTYQQAVTHRGDTYSVATWLGGTDFGMGLLETQFNTIMAYLPAGAQDSVNDVKPFAEAKESAWGFQLLNPLNPGSKVGWTYGQSVGEGLLLAGSTLGAGAKKVLQGVIGASLSESLEKLRKKLAMTEDKFYTMLLLTLALTAYLIYRQF